MKYRNILSTTRMWELDNGFRIFFFPHGGPSVEMQLHIATGSIHEDKYLGYGLSHFLEHMLFQGCRDFPGSALADTVTSLGGDLNAYTGYERTCYRIQLPKSFWRRGAEMLNSQVRFPELPEARFAAERDVILRECERGSDNVERRMLEHFMRTAYLCHPLRHPVIGYRELIAQVTRDTALEYHSARYTPGRAFAVIVGDCEAAEVFDAFSELFGSWQRKNLAELPLLREMPLAGMRKNEFIFKDSFTRIFAGIRAPGFGAPELPALEVLFGMLGTGDSSILNEELVLRSDLALNVRSFCFPAADEAVAGVALDTTPDKFSAMRDRLYKLLQDAADGRISAAAMEREKFQQYADRLRNLRDITNIAAEISGSVLYTGTPAAGDVYLQQLTAVDSETISAVAAEYLDTDKMIEVVQLPELPAAANKKSKRTEPLKCIGTTEVKTFFAEDRSLPLATFSMLLPGGGLFDPPGKGGISALTAALLTAGTKKHSETVILRKLDSVGADISVSAGNNSLMLELSAPKQKFSTAMNLLAEILSSAEFGAKPFAREQYRQTEYLKLRAEHPFKAASDLAYSLLYPGHPYAHGARGTAATLAAITAAETENFYYSLLRKAETVFGFGGDCSETDVIRWSELLNSALPWQDSASELPAPPKFPIGTIEKCISLPREQTVALKMLPGPVAGCSGDELMAFEILANIENGLGSTLMKTVREKHALCYSVGMTFSAGFHPGTVSFYSMTTPDAGERVLNLFEEEIGRIAGSGISDAEFSAAKSAVTLEYAKTLNNPEMLLRSALLEQHYGEDPLALLERGQRAADYRRSDFDKIMNNFFADIKTCADILVKPE